MVFTLSMDTADTADIASTSTTTTHTDTAVAAAPRSRRSLLRLAGGAAAAGAAGAATLAHGQAAAVSSIMYTESVNDASAFTRMNYLGTANGTAWVFASDPNFSNLAADTNRAVLGGWTNKASQPNGVYGYSSVTGGAGVTGLNNIAPDGVGIRGFGNEFGVRADSPNGTGVQGASSNGTGVKGASVNGDGVLAESFNGRALSATSGQGAAIFAECSSPIGTVLAYNLGGGPGVLAVTGGPSAGVLSVSSIGVGVEVGAAGKAQLLLRPDTAPPLQRTDAHEAGEIIFGGAPDLSLWVCIESGSPGKWRKLAGPSTAGTFHPLSPGRVYDSREAAPAPGALSTGQNRLISVADRRNITGGAVAQTNFVPAGATAVAANVTIVSASGAGFVAINPRRRRRRQSLHHQLVSGRTSPRQRGHSPPQRQPPDHRHRRRQRQHRPDHRHQRLLAVAPLRDAQPTG
jgi:hypothetical protein